MKTVSSSRVGHPPTLIACFLHFDISFMLWVLLGALGVFVAQSAGLDAAQKGWLVAVPILSGALLRIPLGLMSDRVGGKRMGTALLLFLYLPLGLAWLWADRLPSLLAVGVMLGVAGASFAVALPLASRWYPAERQGLVMGLAAAGNSGTVLTNLVAPGLAERMGWQGVFGLAMLPLTLVLLVFVLMARDNPLPDVRPVGRSARSLARQKDLWWLCLFYSITFGGYVGLSSFLPLFFRDQYLLSPITAGQLTACVAVVGSVARPLGGLVADRIGGVLLLAILLLAIAVAYAVMAVLPTVTASVAVLLCAMLFLGLGNGAVFQLVPVRFQQEVGGATGIIGSVGGLGGFALPILLGTLKGAAGSFSPGFLILAAAAAGAGAALGLLALRSPQWRTAAGAAG
jgi:NNP family nitrate/nitrite transporter-like MFS transporter